MNRNVLGALGLLSGVCLAVLAVRCAVVGRPSFLFLAWNLLLAWMPVLFAHLAMRYAPAGAWLRPLGRGGLVAVGALGLWLLFFPNAPYLFTDFAHLPKANLYAPAWLNVLLFGVFALTGVLLGMVSLLGVHGLLARKWGTRWAWGAVGAVCYLAGYGVYLGRIERWNSWDALHHPVALGRQVLGHILHPAEYLSVWLCTLSVGSVLLLSYFALRNLRQPER